MSDNYNHYTLEEQLQVIKDNLPMLRDIHEALLKFNERQEKLEIEHKVDLTDVKGVVKVEDKVEVNDLPNLIQAVEKLWTVFDDKDFSTKVDVKAPNVKVELKQVEKLLKELVKKDVIVNTKENKITFPTTPKDALPVRLVTSDGKSYYEARGGVGSGGGIGKLANVNIVESTDNPGIYGLVVLNPDGTALSTGGGTTPTDYDNLLLESGDNFLLENGSQLLLESA